MKTVNFDQKWRDILGCKSKCNIGKFSFYAYFKYDIESFQGASLFALKKFIQYFFSFKKRKYHLFFLRKQETNFYLFVIFSSLDARKGGSLETGEPWSDKSVLGSTRVKFHLGSGNSPSGLMIHPVEARDEGYYRCRVDFQSSPTRNSRIRIQVIGK